MTASEETENRCDALIMSPITSSACEVSTPNKRIAPAILLID